METLRTPFGETLIYTGVGKASPYLRPSSII